MIKSRRMRSEGHIARMGEKWNIYTCRILVGKPETKKRLRRQRRMWEDNIKMDLEDIGWGRVDRTDVTQDRDQWSALVNTVMNLQLP
jgi:hypothetical protein